MKKVLSFVLLLLLTLTALSVTAFAQPEYTLDSENRAVYENAYGYVFDVDSIDGNAAEATRICTDTSNIKTNWPIYVIIQKIEENVYVAVSDAKTTGGTAVTDTLEENQLFFVVHSASSRPSDADLYPNWQDSAALSAIKTGDVFTFEGVDFENNTVNNGTVTISKNEGDFEMPDQYPWAEKKTHTGSDGTVIPYRIALPENYDENKSYPLIVFFHGAGERGNDNSLQLFHCVKYIHDNTEAIVVAPQCPVGHQWVDTPWANGAYSVDKVPESNEMKTVMELVTQLKQDYPVDSDRVYASGISMGGFGTWDAMMRHSDVFAAAIAVCGGGDVSKGEVLKDVPMFVFHGTADETVPFSGSQLTVDAIKAAGGTKVEFTVYEGAGHGIWNDSFATPGLLDKLLECKLSDRISTEVSEEASEEVSEDVSDTSEDKGGISPVIIAIIAVAVIAVAALAWFLIKKK